MNTAIARGACEVTVATSSSIKTWIAECTFWQIVFLIALVLIILIGISGFITIDSGGVVGPVTNG